MEWSTWWILFVLSGLCFGGLLMAWWVNKLDLMIVALLWFPHRLMLFCKKSTRNCVPTYDVVDVLSIQSAICDPSSHSLSKTLQTLEWRLEDVQMVHQMDSNRIYRVEYRVSRSFGLKYAKSWLALYGPWMRSRAFPPYALSEYQQTPDGMLANDPLQGLRVDESKHTVMAPSMTFTDNDVDPAFADPRKLAIIESCRGPLKILPSEIVPSADPHTWPAELVLREVCSPKDLGSFRQPSLTLICETQTFRWSHCRSSPV